jgi:hypothetical protein
VHLAEGVDWPSCDVCGGPVRSLSRMWRAGATAGAIPQRYKQAIYLLLLAHWYENRESVVVGTTVGKLPLAFESLALLDKVWY